MDTARSKLSDTIYFERIERVRKWVEHSYERHLIQDTKRKENYNYDFIMKRYSDKCLETIENGRDRCVVYFDRETSERLRYLYMMAFIMVDGSSEPVTAMVSLPDIPERREKMRNCMMVHHTAYIIRGKNEHEIMMRILYLLNVSNLEEEQIERRIAEFNSLFSDIESESLDPMLDARLVREMKELQAILSIPEKESISEQKSSAKNRRFTTVSIFAKQRMRRVIESREYIDIVSLFRNKCDITD